MTVRTPLAERVAGAPISWGVCEVPGWGHQLDPDVVLTQMCEVGISATEFGPDGFLPEAPEDKAATLAAHGLGAVGQFVPVVLHDPSVDPLPTVETAMTALVAAQASTVVLAAATGAEGYDDRPVLDDGQWSTLLHNLDRISAAAAARGLTATLHPHVGTMVESGEETDRVLAGSTVGLCLDTGHLLIGGGDPVGVAAIVTALEGAGYSGWYVLEQDTILTGAPEDTGVDPVADVRASIAHILAVARSLHLETVEA